MVSISERLLQRKSPVVNPGSCGASLVDPPQAASTTSPSHLPSPMTFPLRCYHPNQSICVPDRYANPRESCLAEQRMSAVDQYLIRRYRADVGFPLAIAGTQLSCRYPIPLSKCKQTDRVGPIAWRNIIVVVIVSSTGESLGSYREGRLPYPVVRCGERYFCARAMSHCNTASRLVSSFALIP